MATSLAITEDDMSELSELEMDSKETMVGTRKVKLFKDYMREHKRYLKIFNSFKKATSENATECYKCELYERGSKDAFIEKRQFIAIANVYWERCGREVNPSGCESFIGHFICIRCAIAILTSRIPIISMRSELRCFPPPFENEQEIIPTTDTVTDSDLSE